MTSGLILLIISIAFYFVPSIVAAIRSHHQTTAIVLLNILLGWTGVGWVIALVWAVTRPSQTVVIQKGA